MIELTVSASELQDLLRCHRKWYLGSFNRMQPRSTHPALSLGTAVHAGLEAFYSGRTDWLEEMRGSARPPNVPEDRWLEAESGLKEYVWHVQNCGYDDEYEAVAVEIPMSHPIPRTRTTLRGRCDLLVRDRQGDHWLVDHKSSRTSWPTDTIDIDLQFTAYLWLARQVLPFPVRGLIINTLKLAIPPAPKVLMNGQLSREKVPTTYRRYLEEVYARELPVEDYLPYLQTLKTTGPFFQRSFVVKSDEALKVFSDLLPRLARRAAMVVEKEKAIGGVPSAGMDCVWMCDFYGQCGSMHTGTKIKEVMQTLTVGDDRYGQAARGKPTLTRDNFEEAWSEFTIVH